MKRFLLILLALSMAISSISCATIISGRTQDLPVITQPSDAIVTIGTNKQNSPATFLLDRRQGIYVVKIEKDGYDNMEVVLKKGINGWVFGNLIFGGAIGIVIDISTGAASKFKPSEVEVNLVKNQLSLSDKDLKDKSILFVKLIESK